MISGLVAGALQQFRKCLLAAVEFQPVVEHAVEVAVFARENHRPRWSANGVGHQAAVKAHALFGQAVDTRGLIDLRSVGANRLVGMVVREDEHDVWFSPERRRLLARRR